MIVPPGLGGARYGDTVWTYPDPELTDGTVRLRRWRQDDQGCVAAAATDPAITTITTVPPVWTPAAGRAFVHRQWSRLDDGLGVSLAVARAATGEAVGLVILQSRPHPGVAGLGYWIVPDARRAGLAARAARLICTWALERPDVHRVEALTHIDNTASQRTLLAAGFDREGTLRRLFERDGARVDGVMFSRI